MKLYTIAHLKDATTRFAKLYQERKDYKEDAGYVSITEELSGVQAEIDKIMGKLIQSKD